MRRQTCRGAPRGDAGVSPVIGMVLILAISVLGIVAVTNWGLPAITAMQDNVAQRAVLNEFSTLDAGMQKLIAGTTGQTSFKWQPGLGQGAINVGPAGHRWLVASDVQTGFRAHWDDVEDANNVMTFRVTAGWGPATPKMHVWRWLGGAATELQFTGGPATCTPASIVNGANTLYLRTNQTTGCTDVPLDNIVLSVSLRNEPGGAVTVYHEAFLADVGAMHWNSLGQEGRHVFHSNGAIFSGPHGAFSSESPISISPPRNFTNSTGVQSTAVFARLIKVNGTASFSAVQGAQRTAVFLDFVGTYTLAKLDDVETVSIYVFGPLRDVTYAELLDATQGYTFTSETTGGGATYRLMTETTKPFRFSVAYSMVEVER